MQEEASPSPLTKRTEVIVSLRRLRIGRAIKVRGGKRIRGIDDRPGNCNPAGSWRLRCELFRCWLEAPIVENP